jgi:hypothetical protein
MSRISRLFLNLVLIIFIVVQAADGLALDGKILLSSLDLGILLGILLRCGELDNVHALSRDLSNDALTLVIKSGPDANATKIRSKLHTDGRIVRLDEEVITLLVDLAANTDLSPARGSLVAQLVEPSGGIKGVQQPCAGDVRSKWGIASLVDELVEARDGGGHASSHGLDNRRGQGATNVDLDYKGHIH